MTNEEKQAIEELKSLKHIYNYIVMYEKEYLLQCVETVLNLVETQAKELEKKDKMIDLILEEIVNNHCSIRDIVAEEICDDRCVGNNNWTCFKHIKEYFERKVEEYGNKNTEIG